VDARAERDLIGENREDDTPRPVVAAGDVPAFVTKQMISLLDSAGLTTVAEGGDVVVSTSLKRFFVTETNLYAAKSRSP